MRFEAGLCVLVFYFFLLFSVAAERIFYINLVSCGWGFFIICRLIPGRLMAEKLLSWGGGVSAGV